MDPAFELDQSNPSQSELKPTIQNIVCTVDLDVREIDLMSITKKARNAEYNPKRFKAVIMRIREPKTTALIFTSGKLLCTGAKSEHDARTAARKYARIVQKLGYPQARFKNFCIHNIVGSCDVKFPIRLEVLCVNQHAFVRYEPECFPGLLYRMKKPMVTMLVFKSGKVVITGTKREEEIFEAFENIYPVLKEYNRNNYKH